MRRWIDRTEGMGSYRNAKNRKRAGDAVPNGLERFETRFAGHQDELLVAFPDQPVEELAVPLLPAVGACRKGLEARFPRFDDGHTVLIGGLEMQPPPFGSLGEGVGDGRECLVKGHGIGVFMLTNVYCNLFTRLDNGRVVRFPPTGDARCNCRDSNA